LATTNRAASTFESGTKQRSPAANYLAIVEKSGIKQQGTHPKGKTRLHQRQRKGPRIPYQQYEVEYRVRADISNVIYEAGACVAKWIKEGGEKSGKRVWAAVNGIEVYTTAYIEVEKE